MKKGCLFTIGVFLLVTACDNKKQAEPEAPPPPKVEDLSLAPPAPSLAGLSLAQLIEQANAGCQAGQFEACELSCQALDNPELSVEQVSNLACRCFFTELMRWLEAEPTKQMQQRLCNGFTTVENLFGENGYFPRILASRASGAKEPNLDEYFPCGPVIENPNSKEGFLKLLINLKANRSDFDQVKPFVNQSAGELKAILPTLERAMATNAQCSIPRRLVGNPEEDYVFKSGDLFYFAGQFKLYGAFAQALSVYEFNLNPVKILVENLRVRDFEGEVRDLGTQFIHQFLVADAGNRAEVVEARTHEGETIINPRFPDRPLTQKVDEKPLGVFPREANLLHLKPDFISAFDHLIQSSRLERTEGFGDLISEKTLESYQKIKTSLEANLEVEMGPRVFANYQRILEFPPSISNVSRSDFENNPLIDDPRNVSINVFKLDRQTRTWPDDSTTEALLAIPNVEAILAAARESIYYNFEPEFGRSPECVRAGDEAISIPVTDRERDRITLALPRADILPSGIDIGIAANNQFKIATRPRTSPGVYKFFLGASDGHGNPIVHQNPVGGAAAFEQPPEVIQKIKFEVIARGECPGVK